MTGRREWNPLSLGQNAVIPERRGGAEPDPAGRPQQLAQPSHATHPPGAGASALEHILGDRATMPAAAGLLLDQTWRMHPDLCRYTSAAFYDKLWAELDSVLDPRNT